MTLINLIICFAYSWRLKEQKKTGGINPSCVRAVHCIQSAEDMDWC
jgi:hypothetical protein